MGFMESISSVVEKSFDFSGRASRSEYWFWSLFVTILFTVLIALILISASGSADGAANPQAAKEILASSMLLFGLLLLLLFFPGLSVTVRRLHDTGRSGWWFLVTLMPYVGSIILLVFTLLPSQRGGNKWGDGASGSSLSNKGSYNGDSANPAMSASIEEAIAQKLMDQHSPQRSARPSMGQGAMRSPAAAGGAVTFGKR